MLALIYLGLAICLGDFLCQRFYPVASVPHRWAAATLVGILLSTWFTYLAGLAFARTAEPLLWADLLFFVVAASAIFWFSRKSPRFRIIELRAFGRPIYDWITLGALFIAICVLLIGTLYVNKQGQIRVSGMNAYWYATVEGRSLSEFVRLPDGTKPPPSAIVLSSNSDCQNCQAIQKSGCYLLYRTK